MGILSANNSTSYTANNNCKIYIIKQVSYENKQDFESYYADLISAKNNIRLTKLLYANEVADLRYWYISTDKTNSEAPEQNLYFLKDLLELRNCPLIDFTKAAYVFQCNEYSKSGISDVTSFNCSFSVNGQSSCDIVLNNQDYKFNFKYFNDRENYLRHLKCYFDTNDIIIVRIQKKNTTPTSLLNSFKKNSITSYQDIYKSEENDPFTTVFTGYINDVNESFSYENGTQNLEIHCTGPSKKLTWTRLLQHNAVASKDAGAAILPISAFVTGVQTSGETGKYTTKNKQIVKNAIIRTYSGINNISEIKETRNEYEVYFEKNIHSSKEEKEQIEEQLRNTLYTTLEKNKSSLAEHLSFLREKYNTLVQQNFNKFVKETDKEIKITCNSFINEQDGWQQEALFVIQGTDQPAYQVQFENFGNMFFADFNTVYQFIKGIADKLQFNFYDDPYGTIHFSVPDMTLQHLYKNNKNSEAGTDPNVLTQISSFSQSQNTESIANIQCSKASYFYDLPMDMINDCVKDYDSIAKYGERMMQVLEITGITDPKAMRYASKQMMNKYNRKALANIKVQIQGEPGLKMDKYAYIKDLRKLFYIESYSHSYQAGGNFTTSLNGTYLRRILALSNMISDSAQDVNKEGMFKNVSSELLSNNNLSLATLTNFNKQLSLCNTYEDVNKKINYELNFKFGLSVLQKYIYDLYVELFNYPKNSSEIQQELNGIYKSEEVIKGCYLDGFFWELPFDINPYEEATRIQEEEQTKIKAIKSTQKIQAKSGSIEDKLSGTGKVLYNKLKEVESVLKSKTKIANANAKSITSLEWHAGDFLPHFFKYKPYKIDVNAKPMDYMKLLETAAKNTGPQLKGK